MLPTSTLHCRVNNNPLRKGKENLKIVENDL